MESRATNQPPRLAIYHLILWAFCSAAYLGLYQTFDVEQNPPSGAFAELRRPTEIASATLAGTIIAGAVVLTQSWWLGRRPTLAQPGHWLMMIEVFRVTVYKTCTLAAPQFLSTTRLELLLGMLSFLPSAAAAWAIYRTSSLGWKFPFLILGSYWGISGATFLMFAFGKMPFWLHLQPIMDLMPLILTLSVALAASYDLIAGLSRDWLHWLGVGALLANAGFILLWRLAL